MAHQLEALWTSGTLIGLTDAQLLSRVTGVRDAAADSAFAELILRHGPMVMGVCRQVLRHHQDADDAFQATFLVLVRKARSIRVGETLAPWLYSVAYRTAHRARSVASRYRSAPVEMLEASVDKTLDNACSFDLRPLLHEELNRLPGKYREPIVLCHLEGKSHEEAARLLHWPVGTVSGRLSRGRELLRSRLTRRGGMDVSPAVLSANWLAGTSLDIPLSLTRSTVEAAIGLSGSAVSAHVLSLTRGVLTAMQLNTLKMTAFTLLIGGAAVASVGFLGLRASQVATKSPGSPYFFPAQPDAKKDFIPRSPAGSQAESQINQVPLKNTPRMMDGRRLPMIRTASMILVEAADRTTWEAMSLVTGPMRTGIVDWSKFTLPPGTTAQPVASDNIAALAIKGKRIDSVAVFSPDRTAWMAQSLIRPIEDEINPIVGPGYALYQAGNDFYAFSASAPTANPWGVLHLEEGEEAKVVSMGSGAIEVMQGNRLYVFSLKRAEWSKGVAIRLPATSAEAKPASPGSGF